ncbi:high-potential iron-sulfur protein [Halostagnicola sp. A-GB9-2]|uniref:high-potential iron-sulfur protein n=1 Tax=Halostagnicola sp. A-GB9-2 TaxID=3048066 RepID=UPI0024C0BAA1|nr:high-potential iron-sulfur protein [Halostagnicola sp. A-GB9-2]MDJ1434530.1 high-potential iron-sulfur protein [Halostagnicola sp. A-GB9-2]
MDDPEHRETRRRLLELAGTGSVIALAGCLDMGANGTPGAPLDDRPVDWCLDMLDDEVPEEEATAPSIDGIERRDEDELDSKSDAIYECGARAGDQCGNCTYYIDDRTGDGFGACTEVAGQIRSVDWCALWQPREKLGEGD